MKPKTGENLRTDCEDLLQKSVVEEGVVDVWSRFDRAIASLDQASRDLMDAYLNGTSPRDLAHAREISESAVTDWVNRIKRQIIHELRNDSKVRH